MEKQNSKVEDPITLVKTLVSISIGSICWLRNIFPDEVFSSKIYFVPNESKNITELEKKQQYLKIKTIKKSMSKPTDVLLKIINQHIFSFIDQRNLKVLIFDVMSKENVVLETYIIDFTFLSTFETENAGIQGCSIRKSAQNFLKNIFSMTQSLKVLQQHQKISLSVVLKEEINTRNPMADTFKLIPTSILKRKEMEFVSSRNEDLSKAYCSKFEGGNVFATFSIYMKRNKRKRNSRTLTFDNIVYSQKKKKHSIKIVKINESIYDEIEESVEDDVNSNYINIQEDGESYIKNSHLNCECKVMVNTKISNSLFNCSECGRICHKKCYIFTKEIPSNFSCFNCRKNKSNSKQSSQSDTFQENLRIHLALRRLFNDCCSKTEIPNKISLLIENLGLSKEEKIASQFFKKVFHYKIFSFDDIDNPTNTHNLVLLNDFFIGITIQGYDCTSPSELMSKFVEMGDKIHINIRIKPTDTIEFKESLAKSIYNDDLCFKESINSSSKESKELQELAAPAHNSLVQSTQLLQETQNGQDLTDVNIDSDNFSLFDLGSDSHEADDDTSFMSNSFLKNC